MRMARVLGVVMLLQGSIGCAAAPHAGVADSGSESDAQGAIGRMLDDWHDAAAKADEARYFSHLHHDAVFLGTDASERWDKAAFQKYAHPHFAKGKAWSFRASRRAIMLDAGGTMAHFDEDLDTENLGPARGSGVVAWADNRWVLLHYNLTLTIPNSRFEAAKDAVAAVYLQSEDQLGRVAFLAGSWVARVPGGERAEEHWTSAEGGTLIGSARTIAGGGTTFFEHLRIEERAPGELVYIASPRGAAPTEFRLVRASASPPEVVFENLEHDWPKRITYRLDRAGRTTKLFVRAEAGPGEQVDTWSFERAVVERGPAPATEP